MIIGVPKEIKSKEFRVALTPAGAALLTNRNHRVLVEASAGEGSFFTDEEYRKAGAEVVDTAEDAWSADLVLKVKEPLEQEYQFLRKELTLFTYLHLAANPTLTDALVRSETTAIAYETVEGSDGSLPLLAPMSEVAGRMAPQMGAFYLGRFSGARGVLLGGVPGVNPGTVAVLGGGMVGTGAAKIALGLGARVLVLDINHRRLQYLDDVFGGRLVTLTSNEENISWALQEADLVIGAVLVPGAKTPRLVTREMLGLMKPGSVVVDVAVDQGGCVETIRPTTHDDPTYTVDGVVHYGVANIPGAVPRTSTFALSHQTLPYALRLADEGLDALESPSFASGLNVAGGEIVHTGLLNEFQLR